MNDATSFDEWLEQQFARSGAYAKDIAQSSDVSPGYLSGLRTGKRGRPSRDVAIRIAKAFAVARGLAEDETKALEDEARVAAEQAGRAPFRAIQDEPLRETGFSRTVDLQRRRPRLNQPQRRAQ